MRPHILAFVLSLSVLLAMPAAAGKLTLVRDGKPAAYIHLADTPTDNAKIAAEEFQAYIEKISGAKLPIVSETQDLSLLLEVKNPAVVCIGRSRATDALKTVKIPSGVSKNIAEEGYVLYGKNDKLVLAGNDTPPFYGTRYAVYDLLHRLGVRWFLPGDYGEVVPKMATITVDELHVTERPDFAVRTFWTHSRDTMAAERQLWMIRNRLNPRSSEWLGMPGDSSVIKYMPADKVQEHPEWFALRPDGSRDSHMPCMADDQRRNDPKYQGQPRIVDEFIARVKADAKAGKRSSPMAPEDGMPICACDLCRAMSARFGVGLGTVDSPSYDASISEQWFHFVSKILDGVNAEYPNHLIATNGYANRFFPPELPAFNTSKNLVVMFADIGACTIHGYDDPKCWQMRQQYDLLTRWSQLCDKVWIYNYNYTMLVGKSTIVPTTRRVARNLPALKAIGILGFSDQDDADMSLTGIPTYVVRHALMWNTRTNVDALLADFYLQWYGAAAEPMRMFYTMLEDAFDRAPYHAHEDPILPVIYTPELVGRLGEWLALAEKAAVTDTEKLHVRADRLIYDHLCDYVAAEKAKQDGRYAEAAALMEHMLALKAEMNTITPFFGWRPYPVYCEDWEGKRMKRLAGKVSGPEGELVALMPVYARFRTDPYDQGRIARWMEPKYDDAKWLFNRTTTGWQNQGLQDDQGRSLMTTDGHAYCGLGWYRFEVNLPRTAEGKRLRLFCPALVNQAWVWVNGQYAGRTDYMQPWFRPHELDIDITAFAQPGKKNQITLRVLCHDDQFGANGIYERMFIYAKP